MSGSEKNQYPGHFVKKNVRIEKSNGGIVVGRLREFAGHHGNLLLVVEIGTGQDQVVNFDHVVSIEEGAS